MAGQIRVNTDQVAQIATSIENLNNELRESLLSGQNTIKDLGKTWDGEAATATIGI